MSAKVWIEYECDGCSARTERVEARVGFEQVHTLIDRGQLPTGWQRVAEEFILCSDKCAATVADREASRASRQAAERVRKAFGL